VSGEKKRIELFAFYERLMFDKENHLLSGRLM